MLDTLTTSPSAHKQDSSALSVVSIAHAAVSRSMGRLRYEPLAGRAELDLTLVVPSRWHEYGRSMVAEAPLPGLRIRTEAIRLPKAGPAKWYLHHYPRFGQILEDAAPDVIHLWEEPWSLVALQAARWRERHRPDAALVIETDQNIQRQLPPPFEQIRRHVLSQTDLLICRTKEALAVSQACGYRGRSEIVEYGIDTATFHPQDRAAARAALGVNGLLLGYVGRLVPEKGLLDVVEGMARSGVEATLLLLGEGPERDAIQTRAAQLGVAVRFFPPAAPAGVATFMASLDALVLMSRTTATWKEQFGRVIMEAHGCGIPVIGSSSGSIPGVVGRGGWIVEEGSADAFGRTLRRVSLDPNLLLKAGRNGHQDAMERFTYGAVADGLVRAWQGASESRCRR